MEKLIKAVVGILPKPLQKIYYKYEEKWLYLVFGVLTTVVSVVTKLVIFYLVPGRPIWENTFGVIVSWIFAVTFAFFTNKEYVFKKYNTEGKLIAGHSFGKYQVLKNGLEIYSFLNDDDQVVLRNPLILHSNGRRYLAFHVGLYGISYLEPDSGEVYHYIPEGHTHDYRLPYGESFIITDIHYDEKSNLAAYGGCYWAGPSEVFVGDLQNPLQYDPHLVRIHELLDPEWEEIDDIDFVRWDADTLVVSCDGKEVSIKIDTLRKALRKEV